LLSSAQLGWTADLLDHRIAEPQLGLACHIRFDWINFAQQWVYPAAAFLSICFGQQPLCSTEAVLINSSDQQ
jgi:hypothetical protein